eukprot:gnl/Ergobibamus_cyprinoides/438.p1 GENE.gnl/Ergobibamus_cyprinoides/438~~gnl/Ergobibamus_cyprinoides/438.p1  ORF type:complete len:468 (+),score=149.21 gnl/Ergobibamus_cyprinoides/438:207-1406(+)
MHVAWAITHFVRSASDEQFNSLKPAYVPLLQALYSRAVSPDAGEASLRNAAHEAINELIRNVFDPPSLHAAYSLFDSLLGALSQHLQDGRAVQPSPDEEETQSLAFATAATVIFAAAASPASHASPDLAPEGRATQIIQASCAYLGASRSGPVQEEAILAAGHAVDLLAADFAPLAATYLQLLHGFLAQPDATSLFVIAVGGVGDCARALESGFQPYAAPVLERLFAAAAAAAEYPAIRAPLVQTLGDVVAALGHEFVPHVDACLQALSIAAQAKVTNPDDAEEIDEVMATREAVLTAFSQLVQEVASAPGQHARFMSFVESILAFMALCVTDPLRSDAVVRWVVVLAFDMLLMIGPGVRAHLQAQGWLPPTLTEARRFSQGDQALIEASTYLSHQLAL